MDASKLSAKSASQSMVAALKRPENTEAQQAQKRQAAQQTQQKQTENRAVLNAQNQRIGQRLNVTA